MDKENTWCHRVWDIIRKNSKNLKDRKKEATKFNAVTTYFEENIKPYFCQEVIEYFENELKIFVGENNGL